MANSLADLFNNSATAMYQAGIKQPMRINYQTQLTPDEEQKFQAYLKQNPSTSFDPSSDTDYDLRGWFRGMLQCDPQARTQINPSDLMVHRSDKWKTPYHETFSTDSQYANQNAPVWKQDAPIGGVEQYYLQNKKGKIISDERSMLPAEWMPEPQQSTKNMLYSILYGGK